MVRRPRIHIVRVPLHIVQRDRNRGACYFDEQVRDAYAGWLRGALQREHGQLHAYVLMTHPVHLLLTPEHSLASPTIMSWGQQAARRSTK